MKKFSIKNIIIALIIALSLIGATVFVCITVLGNDDTSDVDDAGNGGDDGSDEGLGNIDDGGWTWD